ncbi:MAG: phosphodiesterase [Anaerolineae bacterium]|nr:phosphodiesterase [Anaerolineae bacterium]
MAGRERRVLVIGLDCADPGLVFGAWREDLPNLRRLMESGAYGPLETCHPPITVPAWSSMMSSRDPGQLGFYGFRNRADYSYDGMRIANSTAVKAPRVWDLAERAGLRSVLVGVPQTYPLPSVTGWAISDFLTPPGASDWARPAELADEVGELLQGEPYEFDVRDFRTEDKDGLLESIYRMTDKRWRVIRHLASSKPWDFFMLVEMGIDRIHHGFWSFMDHRDPRFQPGHRFQHAIRDYYVYVDRRIGELLELVGDDAWVMVVSDHGAQRMEGGFAVNEWLIREGYLALADRPEGAVELKQCRIDWPRTRAWGSGGYYARVFMNVAGREPEGIIPADRYEEERDRLKAALEHTAGPDGRPLGTVALKPEEVYREVNGIAPDLIVYFGGLAWRSVGSIGHGDVYTVENDTGPDDANHSRFGLCIMRDPEASLGGREMAGLHIEHVAPTLLTWLGLEVPADMVGAPVIQPRAAEAPEGDPGPGTCPSESEGRDGSGYTEEEERQISDHLADLGYL